MVAHWSVGAILKPVDHSFLCTDLIFFILKAVLQHVMYFQTKTLNCRVYASVVMLTCSMMFFQHDIHGCLTGNREVAGWVINSAVDMIGRWHEQSKGEESELGRWVAAPTCKCFLSVKAGEVSGMNQSARTSCFDSLAGLGKVSSCNVIFTMQ